MSATTPDTPGDGDRPVGGPPGDGAWAAGGPPVGGDRAAGGPAGRLLLVAPPFSGHLNPLIAIAVRLRERGFEPRFATGPAKVGLLRALGFTADPVLAADPGAFERIADTAGPVRGNPVRLGRQLAANLALLPAVADELTAIVRRDRPGLVLADFTAPVAGVVADRAGLPWITTMPTPFVLETRTGTPAYCGGWGPARHAGHRLRDAAGRGVTVAVKHTFQLIFGARLRALSTSIYRPDGSEAAYSPYEILGLGMTELELARDWPAGFSLIGPVTETPLPHRAVPQLPAGPLVLVTLGTHLRWSRRGMLAGVARLAAAFPSHHFVVSLGHSADPGDPAGRGGDVRAGPVAGQRNVTIYHHLPYDQVMPHLAAVVHHGGAGITYSAVRAGVPSLVWPRDYDQFDYAARIVAAGVGLAVRRLDSRAGCVALGRVLGGLDRGAAAALAAAAARYDPFTAVELAVRRRWPGTPGVPGAV